MEFLSKDVFDLNISEPILLASSKVLFLSYTEAHATKEGYSNVLRGLA